MDDVYSAAPSFPDDGGPARGGGPRSSLVPLRPPPGAAGAPPPIRGEDDIADLSGRGVCIDCGGCAAPYRSPAVRSTSAPRHHRCDRCHRAWRWRAKLWRAVSDKGRRLAGGILPAAACSVCASAVRGVFRGVVVVVGALWEPAARAVRYTYAAICAPCLDRLSAEFDRFTAPKLGVLRVIDFTPAARGVPGRKPVRLGERRPEVVSVFTAGVDAFSRMARMLVFDAAGRSSCSFDASTTPGTGGPAAVTLAVVFPPASPTGFRAAFLEPFASTAVSVFDAASVEAFVDRPVFRCLRSRVYDAAGPAGRRRLSLPPRAAFNRVLESLAESL